MAQIKNNAFAESLSGKLGNLLLKKYSYGTVVSKMPDRSKVKLSSKQKQANKIFQLAVQYARAVKADPSKHKLYAKEVRLGKSLYHAALSDYLKNESLKRKGGEGIK